MIEHRYVAAIASVMVLLFGSAGIAKPSRVPVTVEFAPPPADMKTGDTVSTTLGFRASADLQRLEVSVSPFQGVQVLSQPTDAVFLNVSKGQAPQLTVQVRLTGPKYGSLAVTYKTIAAAGNASGAMTIVYGDASD